MEYNDLLITKAIQYGIRTAYTNLSKVLFSFGIIHVPLACMLLCYYLMPLFLIKVWMCLVAVLFIFLLAVSAQLALDIYNGVEITLQRLHASLPLFVRVMPIAATLFLPGILSILGFLFSSKILALLLYLSGIFFGVRLSFGVFYAIEEEMNLIQALRASWAITSSYFLQLFALHIIFWMTWSFFGAVGFSIFPALGLAHVYFYKQLSEPAFQFTQPPPYM